VIARRRRLPHVQAVSRRAWQLSEALGADGELLHAACLHDVGYAPELATKGGREGRPRSFTRPGRFGRDLLWGGPVEVAQDLSP
jgi:hypothetical protein